MTEGCSYLLLPKTKDYNLLKLLNQHGYHRNVVQANTLNVSRNDALAHVVITKGNIMLKRQLTHGLAVMLIVAMLANCGGINTIISSVKKAIPLLQSVGVDVSSANEVISLANQFETDPNAATLGALTLAFDRLVMQAQAIPDSTKRTVVLVILVAANVALQSLAEKYVNRMEARPDDERLGAPMVRATIRSYAKRPRWQCRTSGPIEKYKAGQYAPMEICKKYPDNTQVETRRP